MVQHAVATTRRGRGGKALGRRWHVAHAHAGWLAAVGCQLFPGCVLTDRLTNTPITIYTHFMLNRERLDASWAAHLTQNRQSALSVTDVRQHAAWARQRSARGWCCHAVDYNLYASERCCAMRCAHAGAADTGVRGAPWLCAPAWKLRRKAAGACRTCACRCHARDTRASPDSLTPCARAGGESASAQRPCAGGRAAAAATGLGAATTGATTAAEAAAAAARARLLRPPSHILHAFHGRASAGVARPAGLLRGPARAQRRRTRAHVAPRARRLLHVWAHEGDLHAPVHCWRAGGRASPHDRHAAAGRHRVRAPVAAACRARVPCTPRTRRAHASTARLQRDWHAWRRPRSLSACPLPAAPSSAAR